MIGDIHGNLPALEAVLGVLEREAVGGYVCTGDLVGYGPFPNECVAAVERLDAPTVAGNHDLIVLGRLSSDACIPLARVSLEWTRNTLTPEAVSFLASLPQRVEVDGFVVTHGSLTSPAEYVMDAAQAARQLELLVRERPDAWALLLGHTHAPAAWGRALDALDLRRGGDVDLAAGGPFVLNGGAVGQSRERERTPRARCLVLDTERRTARFLAVDYDVAATRAALRRTGLSPRAVHLGPPSPARAVAARAKRAIRTVARR